MASHQKNTFEFFYTQLVIEWLDKHEYSRKHWLIVAKECQLQSKESDDPVKETVNALSRTLKDFHKKYRVAVVKDFNLLADILEQAFDHVDWVQVAESRVMGLEKNQG
jgi:hypothetical protein